MKSDKVEVVLFPGQDEKNSPVINDPTTWVSGPSGQGSITSNTIKLFGFKYFGAMFVADSQTGTANVKVEILVSHYDVSNLYNLVPINSSESSVTVGETTKSFSVGPVPSPFLKFKITGLAGNPTDTRVFGVLFFSD